MRRVILFTEQEVAQALYEWAQRNQKTQVDTNEDTRLCWSYQRGGGAKLVATRQTCDGCGHKAPCHKICEAIGALKCCPDCDCEGPWRYRRNIPRNT